MAVSHSLYRERMPAAHEVDKAKRVAALVSRAFSSWVLFLPQQTPVRKIGSETRVHVTAQCSIKRDWTSDLLTSCHPFKQRFLASRSNDNSTETSSSPQARLLHRKEPVKNRFARYFALAERTPTAVDCRHDEQYKIRSRRTGY